MIGQRLRYYPMDKTFSKVRERVKELVIRQGMMQGGIKVKMRADLEAADPYGEREAKAMSVVAWWHSHVVRGSNTHHYIIKSISKLRRSITATGSSTIPTRRGAVAITPPPSPFIPSLLRIRTLLRHLRGRGFRCGRFGRGCLGRGCLGIGALGLSHAPVLAISQWLMTRGMTNRR